MATEIETNVRTLLLALEADNQEAGKAAGAALIIGALTDLRRIADSLERIAAKIPTPPPSR